MWFNNFILSPFLCYLADQDFTISQPLSRSAHTETSRTLIAAWTKTFSARVFSWLKRSPGGFGLWEDNQAKKVTVKQLTVAQDQFTMWKSPER